MSADLIKSWACFGGVQSVYRHMSQATGTPMNFAVFVPELKPNTKAPVLTFLSGLTCSWENFTTKAGAQRYAAEHGLILVVSDTSPRGADVPDDKGYDLGQGASFYVDATELPWSKNFKMWTYITLELPALAAEVAPVNLGHHGIMGHSMGGHGALVAALRHPERYGSLSALAPIAAPSQSPWGSKAFTAYLGHDKSTWQEYDATALLPQTKWRRNILIDVGSEDEFLKTELNLDLFEHACRQKLVPAQIRRQPGYDHSYYFVSTVIGDHIAHHARFLKSY